MPKTLGIDDDYWHGLIPFAVQVFTYPFVVKYYMSVAPVVILVVSLVLWVLQFVNEWNQAVDHDVAIKYGCYENFQYNSRRDTRNFFIGWITGLFVGVVMGAIWSVI